MLIYPVLGEQQSPLSILYSEEDNSQFTEC